MNAAALSALSMDLERVYRDAIENGTSVSDALEAIGRAVGAALSRVDGLRRETHIDLSFIAPHDATPFEVARAMRAGRAWAEREAEALSDPPAGPWLSADLDALPLVHHEDEDVRARLAEIANRAARDRWSDIVANVDSRT